MNATKWVKIYETYGTMDAELLVGRLHAEGIPARYWAESAGRALGLTVGKLGSAYVEVPESFAAKARAVVATDFTADRIDDLEE